MYASGVPGPQPMVRQVRFPLPDWFVLSMLTDFRLLSGTVVAAALSGSLFAGNAVGFYQAWEAGYAA